MERRDVMGKEREDLVLQGFEGERRMGTDSLTG
jgi:hypothetical protein